MLDEAEPLCDLWEAEASVLSHSRLYHLEPLGVGSPLVESLTSYITRLADEHSVYPSVLLRKQIFPLLNRPSFYRNGRLVDRCHFLGQGSIALNGLTSIADKWVKMLEQLTMRSDLHFLTMLPYKAVLSSGLLLRRTKLWCPICYEQWREADQAIYDPLLWMLSVVTHCPKHGEALEARCPNPDCAREQFPLTAHAQSGYCCWCDRWLGSGSSPNSHETMLGTVEQLQTGEMLGALLAAAPSISGLLSKQTLASTLSRCVDTAANGNRAAFARFLQMSDPTVRDWLHGRRIPLLETLVKIATLLRIPLLNFLLGEIAEMNPPSAARERVEEKRPSKRQKREPVGVAENRQRKALEAVIQGNEDPPPSMREVAQRLQYGIARLYKSYPDLCQMISARYTNYRAEKRDERKQRLCEEVRQAIHILHAQGLYPSKNQVNQRLSTPGGFWLPEVYQIWKETIQQLGWRQ